jgi:NTP pyrophosphatase (non-canonical NTP hydrolase)
VSEPTLSELAKLVSIFIKERKWTSYHTPKNLAMSISIEAAEIMELFQWVTTKEALENALNDSSLKFALEDELADVLIYCISMANTCEIDLAQVIKRKLKLNEKRFPPEIVSGKLGPYKIDEDIDK